MPKFSTYNVLGNSIEYDEIGVDLLKWKYVETLTFSADATKTTTSLSGTAKRYKLVHNGLLGNGAVNVMLRLNGLSTNIYDYFTVNNVTPTITSTQPQMYIGTTDTNTAVFGTTEINGEGVGSHVNVISNVSGNLGAGTHHQISGRMNLASGTKVTSVTILTTGTLTGTIDVYEMN